jgi:CheY-like chemotaxis protein
MPILDQVGQSKGAIGLVNDITALKAKEALAEAARTSALREVSRLQAIMKGISAPYAVVTADGRIASAAPSLEKALGASELNGRSIKEVLPDLDPKKAGAVKVTVEGMEKELAYTAVPTEDGGVVLSFTEIVRPPAGEGKVEAARPSESLAHDLNDSLTVIMGSVSLAKEYVIPEGRMYSKLKQIESASVTARDLAGRLMARGGTDIEGSSLGASTALVKVKGKVLLMDDDESILEATGDLLRYLGYTVDAARDGNEALMMCKEARDNKQPFELAILDLDVGSGMGGKEAGQKLRAENPALKLIVSSGHVADPALADPASMGFAAAIPKPYAADMLSKVVAAVLGQRP